MSFRYCLCLPNTTKNFNCKFRSEYRVGIIQIILNSRAFKSCSMLKIYNVRRCMILKPPIYIFEDSFLFLSFIHGLTKSFLIKTRLLLNMDVLVNWVVFKKHPSFTEFILKSSNFLKHFHNFVFTREETDCTKNLIHILIFKISNVYLFL